MLPLDFPKSFFIGFQNHLTKNAITAEKKATIKGHIVLNNTPPVPGSIYANEDWLKAKIQMSTHENKNNFFILKLDVVQFKKFSFLAY